MSTKLVGIDVVADRLGVSVSYVRTRVFRREIPFYKIGAAVRFDLREIDEWVASRRVGAGE